MAAIASRPEPRQAKPRPPRGARVLGYLVAAGVSVALIWLVNVAPGWRWLPFLSDDFARVVGWVTLAFVVNAVVNLVHVGFDPVWARRLGEAVTAAVGCVVTLQLLIVFPFDVGAGWATLLRVVLVLGVLGTGIGAIANLATALRHLVAAPEGR